MELKSIGIIHSPYNERKEAPPQGRMKQDFFELEIFPEYIAGLKDVETASHLIILYWCDRANRETLTVNTPWDIKPHGVFATRSPNRPNPIAFGIADLVSRNDNMLVVKGLDALDNSPILDIKPYSSSTDAINDANLGWFEKAQKQQKNINKNTCF